MVVVRGTVQRPGRSVAADLQCAHEVVSRRIGAEQPVKQCGGKVPSGKKDPDSSSHDSRWANSLGWVAHLLCTQPISCNSSRTVALLWCFAGLEGPVRFEC